MFNFMKKSNTKVKPIKPLMIYRIKLNISLSQNNVSIFNNPLTFKLAASGLDDAAKKADVTARENIQIDLIKVSPCETEHYYRCELYFVLKSKYLPPYTNNLQYKNTNELNEKIWITVKSDGLDNASRDAVDFINKNICISLDSVER